MSIPDLSGISAGVQYDFTNLTRKQAIAAGGELFQEGKLTEQETGYLQGFSVDSAPIHPGGSDASDYGLNSSMTRNYQSLIQQDLLNNEALGQTQQKEINADENLLSVLSPYFSSQSTSGASSEAQESVINLLG